MQISMAGKLTETPEDIRNTLAKFQGKILQNKSTMNHYAWFLAKYWQNLHIYKHS